MVEICNLGAMKGDEWGFTGAFDRENGGATCGCRKETFAWNLARDSKHWSIGTTLLGWFSFVLDIPSVDFVYCPSYCGGKTSLPSCCLSCCPRCPGGFLTDHFPHAAKAIWDFHGVYCSSRHIPGVRFAGIIHPGARCCPASSTTTWVLDLKKEVDLVYDLIEMQLYITLGPRCITTSIEIKLWEVACNNPWYL